MTELNEIKRIRIWFQDIEGVHISAVVASGQGRSTLSA